MTKDPLPEETDKASIRFFETEEPEDEVRDPKKSSWVLYAVLAVLAIGLGTSITMMTADAGKQSTFRQQSVTDYNLAADECRDAFTELSPYVDEAQEVLNAADEQGKAEEPSALKLKEELQVATRHMLRAQGMFQKDPWLLDTHQIGLDAREQRSCVVTLSIISGRIQMATERVALDLK